MSDNQDAADALVGHEARRVRLQRSTRTPDMFADLKLPRKSPRVMMHVCDSGWSDDEARGPEICRMKCTKCGTESDWLHFANVTEAKRGMPCEKCNKDEST